MSTKAAKTAYLVQGSSFIELAYAVGGWALTQTCLSMMHAGVYSHAIMSLPWLASSGLAAWRSLQYKSHNANSLIAQQRPGFTIVDALWGFALFAIGGFIGELIVAGSAFMLFLFATGISYAPWHRISLCRQHFACACLLMLSGGAIVLGASHKSISAISLAINAWVLMGSCVCALL